MADVIVNLRITPENPEVDLQGVEEAVKEKIVAFGGHIHKIEKQPIAFGLVALSIIFISDEKKGDTEPLEEDLGTIEGVQTVEVVDVRRAFG